MDTYEYSQEYINSSGSSYRGPIIFVLLTFILSIVISSTNYSFFHSLIEIFSIVIACTVIIISFNSYKFAAADYIVLIGTAYTCVALIDLLHVLSFTGMNIFANNTANLTTQLGVLSRLVGSVSLLIAFIFINKKFNIRLLISTYTVLLIMFILAIFYWDAVPVAYVDGVGLTLFKKYVEYIILIALIGSVLALVKNKNHINKKMRIYLLLSIAMSMISEVFFLSYIELNSVFHMLGHVFKTISYYFFYKAVIQVYLREPYESLFYSINNLNKKLADELQNSKIIGQKLKESEEKYRELFNNMKSGVVIFKAVNEGEDFEFLEVNKAFMSYSKLKMEDYIGKRATEIYPTFEKYRHIDIARRVYATSEPEDIPKYYIDTFNKGWRQGYAYKLPTGEVVAILQDVTKTELFKKTIRENKKLLNEAIEYDRLRTEFFANISHELRTPLSLMLSTIQLQELNMKKEKQDAKNGRYLDIVKQNCYRLQRLISNLIDITKIDADFFEINYENCDMVSLTEDITSSVAGYIANKGIKLSFHSNTKERYMLCDSDMIERIMLNLLSNAVKFSRPGGHITVSVYAFDDAVNISVRDEGIGIPPDKLDVIFDRFRQVDKSLTRAQEGSGIGLSLVKSLVEKHKGTITVNSKYGEGSEFVIELPIRYEESNSLYAKNNAEIYKKVQNERITIEFSDIYN